MSVPLDQTNVVYALRLRSSSEIRYVGMTTRRARNRLWGHRAAARRGAPLPVNDWMRKHGPENVEMSILESGVENLSDLAERERHWIAEMRSRGHALLNLAEGGRGAPGVPCTPENRKAVGDRFRGVRVPRERIERGLATKREGGYAHSEETRARISAAIRASGYSPPKGEEHWNYGRERSDEHKEKLRLAHIGRKYSPERLEAHIKTRPRGENSPTARFTEAEAVRVIQRLSAGERVGELAEEYGVARQSISRIKSGQTWSHLDRAALNAGQAVA